VIKCITKSEEGESPDSDLALLRHRIPHRFEPSNSRKANWCCHCGEMMPLTGKSRGDALKCTECSLHAHRDCAHLVPHFCGLSSDMITQMLKAIENAEKSRRSKIAAPAAAKSPGYPQIPANVIHTGPMSDSFVVGSSLFADLNVGSAAEFAHRGSIAPVPVVVQPIANTPIPKNVGLNDFSFVAVLGKGNFGKVMLAEERWNRKMYGLVF
jgi:hypothetical protein